MKTSPRRGEDARRTGERPGAWQRFGRRVRGSLSSSLSSRSSAASWGSSCTATGTSGSNGPRPRRRASRRCGRRSAGRSRGGPGVVSRGVGGGAAQPQRGPGGGGVVAGGRRCVRLRGDGPGFPAAGAVHAPGRLAGAASGAPARGGDAGRGSWRSAGRCRGRVVTSAGRGVVAVARVGRARLRDRPASADGAGAVAHVARGAGGGARFPGIPPRGRRSRSCPRSRTSVSRRGSGSLRSSRCPGAGGSRIPAPRSTCWRGSCRRGPGCPSCAWRTT